jgi:heptose-I-phosphate ethanolaminephosphotransferase
MVCVGENDDGSQIIMGIRGRYTDIVEYIRLKMHAGIGQEHNRDIILFIVLAFLFNLVYIEKFFSEFRFVNCRDILTYIFKLFFEIIVFLLLTKLIPIKCIKNGIRMIFLILSGIFCVVDIFSLYMYGTLVNTGIMEVVLATNPNEAVEYIKMYSSNMFLVVAFFSVVLGVLLWKVHDVKIVSSRILMFFMTLSLLIGIGTLVISPEFMMKECLSVERYGTMADKAYKDVKQYEKLTANSKHDVTLTKDDSTIPYVIFILGESTNRNHMGLYGYNLDTTPFLQKRADNGECTVFSDVISPHSQTIPVLKKLFTFYRTGAAGDWSKYTNIFDILPEAGYRTVWISNQESSGIFGNVGRLYANQCSGHKFTTIRDSVDGSTKYDEAVLPILDESLQNAAQKNFYVIHLMGTHGSYGERYPQEYDVYNASDEKDGRNKSQKNTLAKYDNAVRYNDFIVNEIIKRFENKNAIIIYVSDHGEELYENRDFCGHTEDNGTFNMIEIPMIVWKSKEFVSQYSEIDREFNKAAGRPFMTDDMIHVLLDMMKIETADFDAHKSVINQAYNENRERVYHNQVYDINWRNQ